MACLFYPARGCAAQPRVARPFSGNPGDISENMDEP
jgi:hypothetical protein